MKNIKQLCAAIVLTFAFSLPTLAGEIQMGFTPPPPPPATARAATTADEGQTDTDSLTEIALNLLQSVLALF